MLHANFGIFTNSAVPHYTSSGLPPPQSPTRHRLSSDSSVNGRLTSPQKGDQDHSPMPSHHHSWSAGNGEDACREEPTSSQMLYDRIQQLSDRMHSELRPSQDDRHYSISSSRCDEDHTAGNSDLTSDHSSRYSTDPRADSSSHNSTLVGETSLNTSNEDENAILRDSDSKDLNSRALVVYSEVNELPLSNTEEQEQLCEDLEHNGGAVDSDGDHGHSQEGSGKVGGGGPHKPRVPTDDIDPKLYKALEKMRKLDEKLANVTKVSLLLPLKVYQCLMFI